jgi:hypothetical protein
MPEYLLELYTSRGNARGAADGGRRIRTATEELTRQGTPIQYRRTIFAPTEETCFVLLEADSADAVGDAARLATLPCDRVRAAVSQP